LPSSFLALHPARRQVPLAPSAPRRRQLSTTCPSACYVPRRTGSPSAPGYRAGREHRRASHHRLDATAGDPESISCSGTGPTAVWAPPGMSRSRGCSSHESEQVHRAVGSRPARALDAPSRGRGFEPLTSRAWADQHDGWDRRRATGGFARLPADERQAMVSPGADDREHARACAGAAAAHEEVRRSANNLDERACADENGPARIRLPTRRRPARPDPEPVERLGPIPRPRP
jgi:hypothetical protein